MNSSTDKKLSRRERQIMDILYEFKESSAHAIRDKMTDAPSYSTVRALLAKMLDKGYVKIKQEGAKYIYFPTQEFGAVRQGALKRLVKTFFGGSTISAVTALVGMQAEKLDKEEIEKLEQLIAIAKRRK